MIYLYLRAVGAAERRQSVVFKVGLPACLPVLCLMYMLSLSACICVSVRKASLQTSPVICGCQNRFISINEAPFAARHEQLPLARSQPPT
jgi:hypothetical protein